LYVGLGNKGSVGKKVNGGERDKGERKRERKRT
jgi:hypothetical protein